MAQDRVGVRELKAKLSTYVRRAAAGDRVLITDRGEPVAVLGPAPQDVLHERVERLLRGGRAAWAGGMPRGARRPPKVRQGTVADAVIEGRR